FTFTIPSNQARLIKSLLEQNEDLQRELANSDQMNSDSQNIKDSKKEKASKKKKSSIYRSMRDPFQGKFFLGIIGIGCIVRFVTTQAYSTNLIQLLIKHVGASLRARALLGISRRYPEEDEDLSPDEEMETTKNGMGYESLTTKEKD
ncbi:hypothetical protein ACJX0J_000708, partial (mitochondrion) [Zea mays]